MNKRILSAVASIGLAGIMCAGLAACGKETAESITGEEVSAEQWAAAFENEDLYKNFKLSFSGDTEIEMKVPTGETTTVDMKVSGTESGDITYADSKTYSKNTATVNITGLTNEIKAVLGSMLDRYQEGTTETEYYVDESTETAVYYAKVDGNWKNVQNTYGMYASGMELLDSVIYMADVAEKDFGDFEYSAEHKGYIQKETSAEDDNFAVIKFKDGKVKALIVKSTDSGDGMTMKSNMSYVITYEGQSVTLPTVSE